MFIDNAHPSLAHHMTMNCLQTYKDIKEKGMILEQGLIKDGVVKIYKEANQNQSHSNDKSRYWNKNKHVATDGVTDTRHGSQNNLLKIKLIRKYNYKNKVTIFINLTISFH
ncbi:hypothetical protein [Enterobacter hormaechei]|uniref:hypothetical protein n=1 Tax=Enterobacter hormaechei TaxID=158836 RepID=UPI0023E372BF|nr:hypothetical protein [Enterobacter hormaechei]MDF3686227.1 hypothetical protein [Enterobacter hormaechei]